MADLSCPICNKSIDENGKKFCGHKCYWIYRKQNKMWPPSRKGAHISEGHKKAIGLWAKNRIGDKAWNWKGMQPGYAAVHSWIFKYFKKISKCDLCGKTDAKKYEWANKSGRYLRIDSDWIRLCKACHFKYDNIGQKMWATRRRANV